MDTTLATGVRRLPSAADIDAMLAGYWAASVLPTPAVASAMTPLSSVAQPVPQSPTILATQPGLTRQPNGTPPMVTTGTPAPVGGNDETLFDDRDSSETAAARDSLFALLK
jgi:hypothetical protein